MITRDITNVWSEDYIRTKPIDFKGSFSEDNFGNLYYSGKESEVYKFNFTDISSSFEQLTYENGKAGEFHVADNGVFWYHSTYSGSWNVRKDYIDITWPHRGSMRFGYVYGLPEEDWYYKKLTGETQIKVYADAHEFTLNPKYHSIVCCFRNNPVVILLPYYELDADFPWLNDDERNAVSLDIIETMKEQPLKGLCYVVELGNEYGDVTLDTDSKIVDNESEFESYLREVEKYINDGHSLKLPDHIPEPMLVYSNWNSTLAYDNYIFISVH